MSVGQETVTAQSGHSGNLTLGRKGKAWLAKEAGRVRWCEENASQKWFRVKAHTRKEEIMDYIQSVASWIAMKSIMARTSQRRATGEANPSQPEEEFVPFHLSPAKPQPTEEAQPQVAAAA